MKLKVAAFDQKVVGRGNKMDGRGNKMDAREHIMDARENIMHTFLQFLWKNSVMASIKRKNYVKMELEKVV